jgi:putative ABC transport system permease protein
MEKLFGLEMSTIALVLSIILALVVLSLLLFAWRRPVFFKLGVRPIPRRRTQTTLIILGLMLATLIITAAFITGDTLSHSIRSVTIEGMGEMDEYVHSSDSDQGYTYFRQTCFDNLTNQMKDYPLIDQILPAITESAPVVNRTQRSSLRSISIFALRPEDLHVLPQSETTDTEGNLLSLSALQDNEVYLNAAAAEMLNAKPGDQLELYVSSHPKNLTVRAITAKGEEARMLLSLEQAQRLFNQHASINVIIVSNQGDSLSGVVHSQEVTSHLRGLLSDARTAAQLYAFLARDPDVIKALRDSAKLEQGNTRDDLLTLADGLQAGSLTPGTRSLLADTGLSNRVQSILLDANWGSQSRREYLSRLFSDLSDLVVDDVKRDTLDMGETAASAFTTIFIVSGLFGITAGLILIFLIFVMLAAERKPEMGMARAVGAQRGHLVEMFVYEGTAYDLIASAVGVGLGVAVGLIIALTLGQAFTGVGLEIRPNVTFRSVVVSYSLGMLVTFATVLISANRVSHLNIVYAIHDLPEPPRPPTYIKDRFLAPFLSIWEGFRALFRFKILHALQKWVIALPGSIIRLIWLGFTSGPFTLILGIALTQTGVQQTNGAAYSSGVSFVIIGSGLLLRSILGPPLHWISRRTNWNAADLKDRIALTLMGLTLTIFWMIPSKTAQEWLGMPQDLSSGPEMLFISGIMLVAGAVTVIMFNTDLLLRLILLFLGRSPHLAPVLRMAIAYPLSNRFRTGMTIAIFAVVIFSVIFMATLFKVNDILLTDTEQFTGGFDLRVEYSSNNPIEDLTRSIIRHPALKREDFSVISSLINLPVEIKQSAKGNWAGYILQAGDEVYLENIDYEIAVKAEGYQSSEEIWQTVRENRGYAIADRYAVPSRSSTNITIGGPEFSLEGVYLEDESMPPITLEIREPNSEASFEVTVIGVLEQSAITGFGMVTSQETLEKGLNFELPSPTYYVTLADGVDVSATSTALESVFLENGLESTDLVQELRDSMAIQLIFQQLLLGFLTVGLVVGVAALGVISTRSVVERRQQIGMLRALGFQREMVSWVFLIESSFVALLGIILGIGLALIPASQMINDMAAELPGISFQVPWKEILIVFTLAYGMTLLTTWLPAIQASRVKPAEALRYE